MQDTWPITQQRLQAWQDSTDEMGVHNAWELRRILSSSQFLPQIVQLTVERSPLRDQALSPEHHWAFGLDKLPEDVAVPLLLAVVQQDLPRWQAQQAERDARQLLDETRASVHSEGEALGSLEAAPLDHLMLRFPGVSIVVFSSSRGRPNSTPSSSE